MKREVETVDGDRWLTPGEVGQILACHPSTVTRLIGAGELPAIRIGKRFRVWSGDLAPARLAPLEKGERIARPRAEPTGEMRTLTRQIVANRHRIRAERRANGRQAIGAATIDRAHAEADAAA